VYSPQVLDHFEHPRNTGVIGNADVSVQVENPVCGDVLKLTARIADDRISEIKFLAQGCVPAMACASALTELMNGKTLQEAQAITREQLITAMGRLPEASSHAAQLAIDALSKMLKSSQTFGRVPSGQ
jgi:nitrogen fixation NifU-like protein